MLKSRNNYFKETASIRESNLTTVRVESEEGGSSNKKKKRNYLPKKIVLTLLSPQSKEGRTSSKEAKIYPFHPKF